jgi:hypothetical protein
MGGAYLLHTLTQGSLAWLHATRIYHSTNHQLLVWEDELT